MPSLNQSCKKGPFVITVYILIGLLCVLCIYHQVRLITDHKTFPAPGEFYEVDGSQLHLWSEGQGTPTVVLDNGAGFGCEMWRPVIQALGRETQVVAYDRPGVERSEHIEGTLTPDRLAEILHGLLDAAGIDGPLVLVGMSAGGIYTRRFREKYPERVVGMVFVDSSHEQMETAMKEAGWAMTKTINKGLKVLPVFDFIQPLGVTRLLNAINPQNTPEMAAMFSRPGVFGGFGTDARRWLDNCAQPDPPASLGDLPLTVISQGDYSKTTRGRAMKRVYPAVWTRLQSQLVALSSQSRHVIAGKSGHMVHMSEPDLVATEILALVRRLREEPTFLAAST